MPLYEFRCESCGHEVEIIMAFSDPLPTTCETCGGALKKLLAAPAVQFKGSGFYLTDYGRSGSDAGSGGKESKAKEPGGASPEAKPSGDSRPSGEAKGGAASSGPATGGDAKPTG